MSHKRNPETDLVKQIKADLEAAQFLVRRVHSGKVKSRGGSWLQLAEAGTADLVVQAKNLCAWLEVKLPGEVQNEDQVEFQAQVDSRGGFYAVVRSTAEAFSVLARWGCT